MSATPGARVRALLAPHRSAVGLVVAASLVNAAAQSTRAWLLKPLTGALLSHHAPASAAGAPRTPATAGEFLWLAGAMLGCSLVVAAAAFVGELTQKRTIVRVLTDLRLALATHLLGIPIARYARERVGDLLSRLTTDIRASEDAIRTVGFLRWEHGSVVLGAVVVAALVSWPLTLLLLLPAIPLTVGFLAFMGGRVRARSERNLQAQADLTQSMQQVLSGIKVIKVFHTEAREKAAYAERNAAQLRRAARVAGARAWSRGGAELVINVLVAGALGLGGLCAVHGTFGLTLDDFAAFSAVLLQLYTPIRGLNQMLSAHQESLPAVTRATGLLDWAREPEDLPDASPCPRLARELRLERVTFTHDGADEPALRDVSITVPAGSVTALVGESGAGKSTLLDLLLRLADPQAGTVRWDGHDLRRLQRRSLRDRIALVSQDPFLFHASVAENLRYGRPDADDAAVDAAARAADAYDVIAALPQGTATILGERGQRLSGGERQRLTIARALLRDPDLLLLDEATAALDSASEARVLAALHRLMQRRTTIWVAHRLTSVMGADQIVVLDGGAIVERGTHATLLAADGVYARLWREQAAPVPGATPTEATP